MSDDKSEVAPGFTRSTGPWDAVDVELASLSGEGGAEAPALTRELEAWRAAFSGVPAEAPKPAPAASPPRSQWRWLGAALAAAAAVGVVTAAVARPGDEVRAMGGLPVDVGVRRAGELLPTGSSLSPGDELFVRFVAPRAGVVTVATLEADGDVSVLDGGTEVTRGGRYVLDGAARLDDHRGREWLVVTLDDRPTDPDALRALLPDPAPGPDVWVLDVTRAR